MKVLLVHDAHAEAPFADALEAAGHRIVRCTESGRPRFPCDGLDGSCPLDGTVDVAVVVHDRPGTDIHPGEAGVVCALRDGLPLVVAGNGSQHGFGEKVTAVAAGIADVASACDRAVAARDARLARSVGGEVQVRGNRAHATLPAGATQQDITRATQAIRAATRAAIVDIAVASAP